MKSEQEVSRIAIPWGPSALRSIKAFLVLSFAFAVFLVIVGVRR